MMCDVYVCRIVIAILCASCALAMRMATLVTALISCTLLVALRPRSVDQLSIVHHPPRYIVTCDESNGKYLQPAHYCQLHLADGQAIRQDAL